MYADLEEKKKAWWITSFSGTKCTLIWDWDLKNVQYSSPVAVVGSSGFCGENRSLACTYRKCCCFLFWLFIFPLLVMFLISWATVCWSFALWLEGFRRIPHPHIPCFPALPFSLSPSGCCTFLLSLCTNLAERKKTTGIFLVLLILITLSFFGNHLFFVLCVFWALASCASEAGCVSFIYLVENLRWWIRVPPPSPCPLYECLRYCLEEKWWWLLILVSSSTSLSVKVLYPFTLVCPALPAFPKCSKSEKSFFYLVLVSACRWSTADVSDHDLLQRLLFFLDTWKREYKG